MLRKYYGDVSEDGYGVGSPLKLFISLKLNINNLIENFFFIRNVQLLYTRLLFQNFFYSLLSFSALNFYKVRTHWVKLKKVCTL